MPLLWLFLLVLAIAAGAFVLARARVMAQAGQDRRTLHSLPIYYGSNAAMKSAIPALLVLVLWLLAQPFYVNNAVSDMIPESAIADSSSRGLILAEVRRAADGLDLAVSTGGMTENEARNTRADISDVTARLSDAGAIVTSQITQPVLRAAQQFRVLNSAGYQIMSAVVLLIAAAGALWGFKETKPDFRARNVVEQGVRALLIAAASIAILTTLGIVLSLVFNTIEFFRLYPASDFFFGTSWAPSFSGRGGSSDLGILPLLWGTFYISIVALVVAVPIGLFAAIYLSEYASSRVRAFAKPMLEVLAGIPTIVYGLFALLTVGPLLVQVFGDDGLGWMQAGTAVMTAGLVMGIMLIPFVSSLSDDIINAVPQSMRDGSYGLGATQSETIRQVVIPAALPGIVGAILLAASRAIGETMIVVLGAGAAARLSLNPFDAMTTVTAKIVSQLTGDSDFASPEALVAFALGMTLFVITLGLNVLALYIVRKYREQYE
ncbi:MULTISPECIES: phosphate ABC transporter permease subunit PstC [Marivita]|uniref:Phosphate transport system permease protein n=1 Tax=Marivita cryptomonadis TaxID=505252 RepID=A0A9Q2RWD9_9RHOB|nr:MULTISPECIES: phosphate ABC transporter permease subunit PstC [Marivita]MCR9168585.1 phosphate ABC transporter permease subunit PstC [Paracoccaceae bacterium]MBM2320792.1 phosphate ABC transporter permease subunit PstC [Marivita cryptomonadis]MBM2330372.1 phosphate ABC transporter permease subunit PstC [Marivita cryptomonadis]MBM2339959.1 phosphate ABC transporter permease subunit PstC [Marivita cryptomonadis]MBM2344619.1 phosphate ABC transporter permease subunit PstC [Marivita cryptomonad